MYYDAIEEVEQNILPPFTGNPNLVCDFNNTIVYTISSVTDADNFCNKYNHSNNYNRLQIGQRIRINDGVYNKTWYIAGFDCEYNHKASDGTIKDNGYGICLIPEVGLLKSTWTNANEITPYMQSTMNTVTLPKVSNNLENVLGNHLVNRNVLLSNGCGGNNNPFSNSYAWTTSYCTLMSGCQLTGEIATYTNKYDDGEANYKLPLFDYIEYVEDDANSFWLRGTYDFDKYLPTYDYRIFRAHQAYIDTSSQSQRVGVNYVLLKKYIRPLIYIR